MDNTHKQLLFNMVLKRVKSRADSLKKFNQRWNCKGSGIEGWLKVEFVAAVNKRFGAVKTGGGGGHKRTGQTFPDILLNIKGTKDNVGIELKASGTDWSPTGGGDWKKYENRVLIFICPSNKDKIEKYKQVLKKYDEAFYLEEICSVTTSDAFYLGLIDLRMIETSR